MARVPNSTGALAAIPRRSRRDKGGGSKKYGRNLAKCQAYRGVIGKPNGPGALGKKAGRHR